MSLENTTIDGLKKFRQTLIELKNATYLELLNDCKNKKDCVDKADVKSFLLKALEDTDKSINEVNKMINLFNNNI
jgi:hypothetical protein